MNFKIDHIVINAVDINNTLHFYTKILDLPSERLKKTHNN
jgi:catechol 2,3-dioxygenase-like lactoylglutathione lyase family enzyme